MADCLRESALRVTGYRLQTFYDIVVAVSLAQPICLQINRKYEIESRL